MGAALQIIGLFRPVEKISVSRSIGAPGTVRSISLVSPARLETCNQAAMSKQHSIPADATPILAVGRAIFRGYGATSAFPDSN